MKYSLPVLILVFVITQVMACYSAVAMPPRYGNDVVLLQPTGNEIDGWPEMRLFPDTSDTYRKIHAIMEESAVSKVLGLYRIAQVYLRNTGKTGTFTPAYIALTSNTGGYARTGFILRNPDGTTTDHSQSSYVDIKLSRLADEPAKLMSFTQLFPHELGHVIYSQVSLNDSVDPESRNVDMHYFAVITDYATAFNEGYAGHFENISRIFEENDTIREGIMADVDRIERSSKKYIKGYLNDFKYPWRLGYFKSSIILWFQQYEDYRRFVEALDGSVSYVNTSPALKNIEDRLSIRNAGLIFSDVPRNDVQLMSTEGVINAFFTRLLNSELSQIYNPMEFYRDFTPDPDQLISRSPDQVFLPLENLFIKCIYVISRHVSKWDSERVQFHDFLTGYMEEFPDEAEGLRSIYREVTGQALPDSLPPQIWMMVKDHDHRFLTIDPFGAVTIPVYTFDLNAAEIEDFLTLPGMTEDDAISVIAYRRTHGLFHDLAEASGIPGLSPTGHNILTDHAFDEEYFNELEEPELNISAIIYTPLIRLGQKTVIYLLVFLIILNLLLPRKKTTMKRRVLTSLLHTILWALFVIAGAASVLFTPRPLLFALILPLMAGMIIYLVLRKRRSTVMASMMITSLMTLVIIFSLL